MLDSSDVAFFRPIFLFDSRRGTKNPKSCNETHLFALFQPPGILAVVPGIRPLNITTGAKDVRENRGF